MQGRDSPLLVGVEQQYTRAVVRIRPGLILERMQLQFDIRRRLGREIREGGGYRASVEPMTCCAGLNGPLQRGALRIGWGVGGRARLELQGSRAEGDTDGCYYATGQFAVESITCDISKICWV